MYSHTSDGMEPDLNDYVIVDDNPTIYKVVSEVQHQWSSDIPPENLIVLPFYRSQLKRIKQTLELV